MVKIMNKVLTNDQDLLRLLVPCDIHVDRSEKP